MAGPTGPFFGTVSGGRSFVRIPEALATDSPPHLGLLRAGSTHSSRLATRTAYIAPSPDSQLPAVSRALRGARMLRPLRRSRRGAVRSTLLARLDPPVHRLLPRPSTAVRSGCHSQFFDEHGGTEVGQPAHRFSHHSRSVAPPSASGRPHQPKAAARRAQPRPRATTGGLTPHTLTRHAADSLRSPLMPAVRRPSATFVPRAPR